MQTFKILQFININIIFIIISFQHFFILFFFTLISSKLTNDNNNKVTINTADIITSTERCGPLLYNILHYIILYYNELLFTKNINFNIKDILKI